MTRRPSTGLNRRYRSAMRNITPRTCEAPSFSVKYMWPVFQTLQFESSPSTQMSVRCPSRSPRIDAFNCETVRTRRLGRGGAGGATGSGGSSSKGSEKRSAMMREGGDLLRGEVQPLDAERLAGGGVGRDDDRIQTRGAGRRFELRRHPVDEPAERGLDADADDRVVRAGHADVGEIRGALRQQAFIGRLDVGV